MMIRKSFVLALLIAVFFCASLVSAQDVKLIANADVPVNAISASDVKNIFLGKKSSWDNGSKITFFTTDDSAVHETFLKDYVGKSPSQFQTFWKKQVFTGKGKMPLTSANDQEMVSQVAGTGGAIGYVSAGADVDGAKTLSIQ